MVCQTCGAEMKGIAVIEDTDELKRILRHLIKIGGPNRDSVPIARADNFLRYALRERDVCPFPGTNTSKTAQIGPIGKCVHSNSGGRRRNEVANRGRCCAFAKSCP
jgi:hypothetical protein